VYLGVRDLHRSRMTASRLVSVPYYLLFSFGRVRSSSRHPVKCLHMRQQVVHGILLVPLATLSSIRVECSVIVDGRCPHSKQSRGRRQKGARFCRKRHLSRDHTIMELPSLTPRGIAIFSGGSAANALVNVFNQVAEGQGPLSYVIPIS